jgi:hypothetical protein
MVHPAAGGCAITAIIRRPYRCCRVRDVRRSVGDRAGVQAARIALAVHRRLNGFDARDAAALVAL